MQEYLRAQIDWEQPFAPEEYAARRRRLRAAMAQAGLDALYVTTPANLTWLTGYDMVWYSLRNLTGLLVRADADDTVLFDSVAHVTLVSTTPAITEAIWLERPASPGGDNPHIEVIVEEVARRGLAGARIGLEQWGYSPHASLIDALADRLRRAGATVTDAWTLVEELRLVKSAAELEHVRRAAAMADEAMAAAREAIRPGVTETALEGVIIATMMRAGGGYPGIRTMIGSGPRSGAHHGPPSRRRVKSGDLVFIDFCGCYERYHVNLNRTFSLGEPDPRWRELMNTSAGCVEAVQGAVELGDPMSKVEAVAQRYIDEVGLRKYVWWVGGYSLGIAVPPDWCGNHWLKPRAELSDRALEPGMVFNLENQFDVWENWPGGSGCAYIETLLVTERGLEVLSGLPRTLVTV